MNKPVVWISRLPEGDVYNCAWAEKQNDDDIPLYTHPVKEEAEQQSYQEADGCPTELAVLKRFWRQHNPVKEPMMVLDGNRVYPAFKELTDGEIQEISHQYHYTYNPDYVGFARAILRKAQEK